MQRQELIDAYIAEVLSSRRRYPVRYRVDRVVRWLRYLAWTADGTLIPSPRRDPHWTRLAPPDLIAAMIRLFVPAASGVVAATVMFWTSHRFDIETGQTLLIVGILLASMWCFRFLYHGLPAARRVPLRTAWALLGGCFGLTLGVGGLFFGELVAAMVRIPALVASIAFIVCTAPLAGVWWQVYVPDRRRHATAVAGIVATGVAGLTQGDPCYGVAGIQIAVTVLPLPLTTVAITITVGGSFLPWFVAEHRRIQSLPWAPRMLSSLDGFWARRTQEDLGWRATA